MQKLQPPAPGTSGSNLGQHAGNVRRNWPEPGRHDKKSRHDKKTGAPIVGAPELSAIYPSVSWGR